MRILKVIFRLKGDLVSEGHYVEKREREAMASRFRRALGIEPVGGVVVASGCPAWVADVVLPV